MEDGEAHEEGSTVALLAIEVLTFGEGLSFSYEPPLRVVRKGDAGGDDGTGRNLSGAGAHSHRGHILFNRVDLIAARVNVGPADEICYLGYERGKDGLRSGKGSKSILCFRR